MKRICSVCTKKKHKKTYFEGYSWYHCPLCNKHGLASIYGDGCTGCSNIKRQPEIEAKEMIVIEYEIKRAEKKWYQFWK